MAQQLSGMAAWMSSIRTSMAKDPCRQLFEDQVQTHGFIFLEDYLENILDGPKQEPIIELVKTPARKKTAPKRTRAATLAAAKAQTAISLFNIDEVELQEDGLCVAREPGDNHDRAGNVTIAPPAIPPAPSSTPPPTTMVVPPTDPPPQTPTRKSSVPQFPSLPAPSSIPLQTTTVVPPNELPPQTPTQKSSVPQLPSLPAPSPLRKSMRVMSMGAEIPAPATAAPAQPPALGKRTSWLTKAREVKAMEGVVPSRTSVLGSGPGSIPASSNTIIPSNGVKRKSSEMLATAPLTSEKSEEGRRAKVAKASESDSAPENSTQAPPFVLGLTKVTEEHLEPLNDNEDEASFMGMFKRTVEGLGARAGKSMGKSLGGGAATAALAEARAAAEARVAERNKIPGEGVIDSEDRSRARAEEPQLTTERVRDSERKLSLSDIAPANGSPAAVQSLFTAPQSVADESISTTPPNSPPPMRTSGTSFILPHVPVFNKQPPPVFVPPTSKQLAPLAKEFSFNLPVTTFTLPPPMSLGLNARLTSPPSSLRPPSQTGGSQQSSQATAFSDAVFDQVDDIPAWMPSTQDTEYTDGSESQIHEAKLAALEDDDDSWPLEEKLAASEQGWTPFNFNNKEDSMTWSTLPTESQGPRTRTDLTGNSAMKAVQKDEGPVIPSAFAMDIDSEADQVQDEEDSVLEEEEAGHDSVMYTSDLGDIIKAGQSTVDLVESGGIPRSHSQLSIASTSQESQSGFLGHATKFVNSMLGTGKKVKPEVKSLQLAAAAAKKQEEEANKKATRLKEMEARRQAAVARKVEEDKARAVEEEKKIKEESEKRKRERDETTEKRSLKPTTASKKAEEDMTKKRKITVEVKKPPSKDKKDAAPPSKLAKSSLATPAAKVALASKTVKVSASSALISSTTYNASQNVAGSSTVKSAATEAKTSKVGPPKGKAKAVVPQENEDKLPSAVVQNQMAARAMAQLRAAKQQSPEVPSESIELPDINSEYSDSEDEDRVRTFDPPNWAQSPELRQALQMQSTVDPDEIFGAIRPLRMEEVFRTRQSRFRARTSSANWSGTDKLTVEEEREYARRMGFTKHAS
ncbi:hypothetical protein K503DRAFT_769917 [Rhizopogon vinicolor AM-OR11-026]|uniref:Inner centromere protein ARK-binding domain-containing protein n=1 Tax=Rhizopogon vinicolor AM-OR11-026 TaxID=1314800 RepID=A0A1B7N2D8_9AGAM|nr:hypothetical protein K503DRAFT_769917 [Rhizopogon vinicolor AM-OR11-026]